MDKNDDDDGETVVFRSDLWDELVGAIHALAKVTNEQDKQILMEPLIDTEREIWESRNGKSK